MPAAPELRVRIDRREQIFVITVRGEVDYAALEGFEQAWEAADDAAMPVTAVDLTQVTFADSMLLNALIEARLRHQATGRDLVLIGPLQSAVSRLLTITGTIGLFTITEAGTSDEGSAAS
ncbi:STAS domain-containing protein [Streptomyces sp. NPDC005917]|uniref:STAS domain-containing protein n=1 Tax=unclassified Streptomyces TaxID=2593676 RepID=UPI0033E93CB5